MDATLSRDLTQWAYALAGSRSFAARHYLIVFVPFGVITVVAEGVAEPELLGPWTAAVGAATAIGLVMYLVAGRLIMMIKGTAWRGALALVAYGLSGLARGVSLVIVTEDLAPLDEQRAITRIVWNALAGVVLLSAVVMAGRELSDVVALQASVNRRRGERRRFEQASGVDDTLSRWRAALREAAESHFDSPGAGSRREPPATAGRRLRDELEARLAAEAGRATEVIAPVPSSVRSADDRRALFTLTADALERIRVPLSALMAFCVAVFHDLRGVDTVGIATLLAGMVVAMAITVVLVPIVAAACRRVPAHVHPAARASVVSLGLLVIGAASALGDLDVDHLVNSASLSTGIEIIMPRIMIAALVGGWAWMVIFGLGPYADALREENLRESQEIVRLAARQLQVLEQSQLILRDGVEHAIDALVARVSAEGGEWYSTVTRDLVLASLATAGAEAARPGRSE